MSDLLRTFELQCQQGDILDALLTIEQMDDLNIKDQYTCTPLYFAVRYNHINLVERLIDLGASEDICERDRTAPILLAAKLGYPDMIDFIHWKGMNIRSVNPNGWNAAHHACLMGHSDVLKKLIELGIDLNAPDHIGTTPLMLAVQSDSINCVKLLIEQGVDLECVDNDGKTAFSHATYFPTTEAFEILYKAGSNVHSVNNDGWNALHFAVFKGRKDSVDYLLSIGLNPLAVTKYFETPYDIAHEFDDLIMKERLKDFKPKTQITHEIEMESR